LTILSQSEEAGVYIVASRGGREFYVTGHSEYSPLTLHNEYLRDKQKGLESVELPKNYYQDNDPEKEPVVRWRSHANLLFINWLNYFVYQETPFELEKISELGELS
jgi:homoserine O-succinyltransferase